MFRGSITLDDLRLVAGPCYEDKDHPWELCTFELGDKTCGYSSKEGEAISWTVKAGTEEMEVGDHTFNTERGHFMAVDLTTDMNDQTGRLQSPYYQRFDNLSETYCVSFYWMADVHSEYMGGTVLNIFYLLQGDDTDYLATSLLLYDTLDHGTWKLAEAEIIKVQADFSVVFEIHAGFTNSSVGLDDVKILPGKCSSNNCDFTYDTCFWTNMKDDEADWLRVVRADGSYLYIDDQAVSDTSRLFTTARFHSRDLRPISGLCVAFSYRMSGRETLSIVVTSSGHERTVWEVSGDLQAKGEWLTGSVSVPDQSSNFQIIIQGSLRSGVNGSLAVDDVRLDFSSSCSLQPETADPVVSAPDHISCSFDGGFCEFTAWTIPELPHNGQLEIVSGRPSEANSGPGSGENKFLFLDSLKYGRAVWAINSSFAAPSAQDFCLSFSYHNFGYSSNVLEIVLETMKTFNEGSQSTEFQGLFLLFNSSKVDQWQRKSLTIRAREYNWRLIFFMFVTGPFGDFSLDEVSLSQGACKESHDCQFELGDLCSWTNLTDSPGSAWQLMSGFDSYETNNTNFPYTDHSSSSPSGHFLAVHVSPDTKPESKARIISKKFNKNFGTQCLSLWSMYRGGSNMVLDVLQYKEETNSSQVLAMFEGFTNQNWADWAFHQVEITETEKFQIILQTEVFQPEGEVQDSVFAIDDLRLEPSPCPALTDCSFDSGVCSFQNSPESPLVWLVGTGRTHQPDVISGPEFSADAGPSYAYLDFTRENLTSEASGQLSTPYLQPTLRSCVSLWFNMFGHHPGVLRVVKTVDFEGEHDILLDKTVAPDSQPHWYRARLEYEHLEISTHRITFLGSYGGGQDGFIAIDDVMVHTGGCDQPPTPPPDPPSRESRQSTENY